MSLKLSLSLPFRNQGTAQCFPDALFLYRSEDKKAYLQALFREIESAALGMEQASVTTLEIINGISTHWSYDELSALLLTIKKHFKLSADCTLFMQTMPGCISIDTLNFCRNFHVTALNIDFVTTDLKEQEQLKLLPVKDNMDISATVFKQAHFLQYGFTLYGNGANHNEAVLRHTLLDALYYDPLFLQFHQLFLTPSLKAILLEKDYLCQSEYCFVHQRASFKLEEPKEVIGLGLNAITRLEEEVFKNTSKLDLYLQASDRFDVIAQKIVQ